MHKTIIHLLQWLCAGLQFDALEQAHSLNASVHFIWILESSGMELDMVVNQQLFSYHFYHINYYPSGILVIAYSELR